MTSSERVTTYEMTSSYDSDLGRSVRSIITPRNLIFQRTQAGSGGGRLSGAQFGASSALVSGGGFAGTAMSEVTSIKNERDREKRDMQDLNERFASYIEKVRFLEAQNRKLGDELEKLKTKWGKESTLIKAMYQTELDEAKRLLEEAEREKSRLEVKLAALEEQLEELRRKLEEAKAAVAESREKLERQNQQLSDYEAEMNLLRRRAELLEGDRLIDKKKLARLQDAINRTRIDLDNETLLHVDAENRRSALEEELEFLKQCHDQELKDLLAIAYRDTTSENRELWKNEMGTALKALQVQHDAQLEDLRNEMDTYYSLKVQEFRTTGGRAGIDVAHTREEITRLRTQTADIRSKINDLEARNANLQRAIDDLNAEMAQREGELESENNALQVEVAKLSAEKESIYKEFNELVDAKLSLELEIASYRKLLEGEENKEGLRQLVDSMSQSYSRSSGIGGAYGLEGGWSSGGGGGGSGEASMSVSSQVRGSMSGRTTYQRSAKGPVAIAEATTDYITLENTGRKDEDLSDWAVKRAVDGSDNAPFKIPGGTVLRSGSKIKFWARGHRPSNAPSNEVEVSEASFGQGKDVVTKLLNPSGDDRASLTQRTAYAS